MAEIPQFGAKIPEFVYLVTVEGEWPISAFADDGHAARLLEKEVRRRTTERSPRPCSITKAHVWKARLTDVHEVELVPAERIEPYIRERAT